VCFMYIHIYIYVYIYIYHVCYDESVSEIYELEWVGH